MNSELSVKIKVSSHAYKVLDLIAQQNKYVEISFDKDNKEIILSAEMIDFLPYTNDWDSVEDFGEYLREDE